MSLDSRIKQELESEAEKIDEILNDQQGMVDLLIGPYKNGLGKWYVAVNFIILLVSGLMFWSAYEFFTTEELSGRTFWGICLVLTINIQIAMKQWIWMEMNRTSLLREVKRVEIEVVKLSEKIAS